MKTEAEIRSHLIERAGADSAFRAQLLADPSGTVEKEFGIAVPEGFTLHIHEDTATSANLVLPPEGGRLGLDELRAIAGGHGHPQPPGPHGVPPDDGGSW